MSSRTLLYRGPSGQADLDISQLLYDPDVGSIFVGTGDATHELVTTTSTQTLLNKIIDFNSNTIQNVIMGSVGTKGYLILPVTDDDTGIITELMFIWGQSAVSPSEFTSVQASHSVIFHRRFKVSALGAITYPLSAVNSSSNQSPSIRSSLYSSFGFQADISAFGLSGVASPDHILNIGYFAWGV